MAQLLSGLEGAVIPRTVRCNRRDVLAGHIPPLSFPLLLRPIGSHGGKGLIRVDNMDTLMHEAAAMVAPSIYLTEYYPFASDDGFWRKYRVIFVGGTWFAYHLSIGQDWLNHYFRTDTNRVALLHAEESHFLLNPEAVLGTLASRALQLLPQRVGLQYFGVDFALDKAGRMIVFECNAAMRVRAPREKTGAKAQAASRIRDALTQMLVS
jgi:glutathione synthase/RimK-type ligase-like ATP-grasp enzyme